jgi:hypothetical protein
MNNGPQAEGQPWIREAIALGREEVTRFIGTMVGFMRRPGRFSADWYAGRQRALNPLGFVASALAISGFVGLLTPDNGADDKSTLLTELAAASLPYVYYAAVGIVSHPLLRLFGSQRRLSASIGVALFAGGGPGLIATLSTELAYSLRTWIFGYRPQMFRGLPLWAAVVVELLVCVPLVSFFVTLMLAMAGLHALPRWRAVAAVTLSLLILAVGLGGLHHYVRFGIGVPHVTLWWHGRVMPDIWF